MSPLPKVSALVSMYSHEEDIDSAIEVFSQAIQYYQSQQVGGITVSQRTSGQSWSPGVGLWERGGDDYSWRVCSSVS